MNENHACYLLTMLSIINRSDLFFFIIWRNHRNLWLRNTTKTIFILAFLDSLWIYRSTPNVSKYTIIFCEQSHSVFAAEWRCCLCAVFCTEFCVRGLSLIVGSVVKSDDISACTFSSSSVKCSQKTVKDAYHIICKPCSLQLEICCKCGKKEDIIIPWVVLSCQSLFICLCTYIHI